MLVISRRHLLLTAGALAATPALQGCATAVPAAGRAYREAVSAVYITADHSQIAVLGAHHHYVFDAPPALGKLLKSDLHKDLVGQFDEFRVDATNTMSGTVQVMLGAAHGAGTPLLTANLRGRRYAARELRVGNAQATELNRTYSVLVQEPSSPCDPALPSPVHQAANGLLSIAMLPLLPLFILHAIGTCIACR